MDGAAAATWSLRRSAWQLEGNHMNIVQKLFCHLFKQAQKEQPRTAGTRAGQWDAMLSNCDLLKARDWIADMHGMENAEAEKRGGSYYYKNEYIAAWEAFRDNPTVVTARTLLEVAPPLLRYFEYWAEDEWTRATWIHR